MRPPPPNPHVASELWQIVLFYDSKNLKMTNIKKIAELKSSID